MKIEGRPIIKTLESYLSRVSESCPDNVSKSAGLTVKGAEDHIELSSKAVEFNRIKSFVSSVPEIRQEKVDQLTDELKNGRYFVHSEFIVSELTREHITEALLTP